MKQEVGYYLHRDGPNLGKHRVPCLLLPSTLDAQFGTPYPRSAGFDTDSNQLACIMQDTANINTTKIRKNEHLKKLLLTRLHARFLFPGRNDDVDPWDDDGSCMAIYLGMAMEMS